MKFFVFICLTLISSLLHAEENSSTTHEDVLDHLVTIWKEGNNELYVPLYTYHMPFAYSPDKLADYTDYPMGLGFGKGITNERGNWEALYAMTFKDSHGIYQYMAGYAWVPMWNIGQTEWKYGVGVTAFLMSRQDIFNYTPFPAALPVGSVSYKNLSLQTTYIPGGKDFGNVVFTWAKWSFL